MTDSQTNGVICPICNRENKCQVNQCQPCWCFNINIPEALLTQLPTELRNKKCICKNCVDDFINKKA